jgi:PIN domain nuclease of toxin-antitoxin system
MRMVIEQLNLRPLQLTFDDFAAVEHLTAHHNDPFDHLFIVKQSCTTFQFFRPTKPSTIMQRFSTSGSE